jgi:hypothetical protein
MFADRRRGPFYAQYQQLRLGMSKEEVDDILGPPQEDEHPGGTFSAETWCGWRRGEQTIGLRFENDFQGGCWLREKSFDPESAWERTRRGVTDLVDWVKHFP